MTDSDSPDGRICYHHCCTIFCFFGHTLYKVEQCSDLLSSGFSSPFNLAQTSFELASIFLIALNLFVAYAMASAARNRSKIEWIIIMTKFVYYEITARQISMKKLIHLIFIYALNLFTNIHAWRHHINIWKFRYRRWYS